MNVFVIVRFLLEKLQEKDEKKSSSNQASKQIIQGIVNPYILKKI